MVIIQSLNYSKHIVLLIGALDNNMKLVKYSDNDKRGEYIWFYVDDQVGTKISPEFKTLEDANAWLDELIERVKNNREL